MRTILITLGLIQPKNKSERIPTGMKLSHGFSGAPRPFTIVVPVRARAIYDGIATLWLEQSPHLISLVRPRTKHRHAPSDGLAN